MSFTEAVKTGLSGSFQWAGRSSRSAFWWFWLFSMLVSLVIQFALGALSSQSDALVLMVSLVGLVIAVGLLFPGLAVTVRRLHDQGKSGWWYWVVLVPFVGGIWLLILLLLPGTPGPNQYGSRSDDWV